MNPHRTVLRCDGEEHELALSLRDVRVLDGTFFAPQGAADARALIGLDFVKGLGAPSLNQVLVTHQRAILVSKLEALLAGLEAQRELLSHDYRFSFSGQPERSGSGRVSGFRVGGRIGSVSTRPSGYCDVTISEVDSASGRARVVDAVDMRRQRELQTDDWGLLKISRRAADVGWYAQLPAVLTWLDGRKGLAVEILHR